MSRRMTTWKGNQGNLADMDPVLIRCTNLVNSISPFHQPPVTWLLPSSTTLYNPRTSLSLSLQKRLQVFSSMSVRLSFTLSGFSRRLPWISQISSWRLKVTRQCLHYSHRRHQWRLPSMTLKCFNSHDPTTPSSDHTVTRIVLFTLLFFSSFHPPITVTRKWMKIARE